MYNWTAQLKREIRLHFRVFEDSWRKLYLSVFFNSRIECMHYGSPVLCTKIFVFIALLWSKVPSAALVPMSILYLKKNDKQPIFRGRERLSREKVSVFFCCTRKGRTSKRNGCWTAEDGCASPAAFTLHLQLAFQAQSCLFIFTARGLLNTIIFNRLQVPQDCVASTETPSITQSTYDHCTAVYYITFLLCPL